MGTYLLLNDEIMVWIACGVPGLMRCMYIFAVLELEEERDSVGVSQLNGDDTLDDQTQMTSFEINLKDKKCVAPTESLLSYICWTLDLHLGCLFVNSSLTFFELPPRYQGDFRPLVEGCGCYCCKNHQRAYLHHLLVTNELLAGVLLMIHNTAHYHGFFSALREAVANDKLDILKRRVLGERGGQTERKE